jgi:hypothetical protein
MSYSLGGTITTREHRGGASGAVVRTTTVSPDGQITISKPGETTGSKKILIVAGLAAAGIVGLLLLKRRKATP